MKAEYFKKNSQVSQKFQITEQLAYVADLLQRNMYNVFWTYAEDGIWFSVFSRLQFKKVLCKLSSFLAYSSHTDNIPFNHQRIFHRVFFKFMRISVNFTDVMSITIKSHGNY